MPFTKKVIILNSVESRDSYGIFKLNSLEQVTELKSNLLCEGSAALKVLIRSVGIPLIIKDVEAGKTELSLGDYNIDNESYALVLDNEDKVILFGDTTGDRVRPFSLLDEYRKLIKDKHVQSVASIASEHAGSTKTTKTEDVLDEVEEVAESLLKDMVNTAPTQDAHQNIESIVLDTMPEKEPVDLYTKIQDDILSDSMKYTGDHFYNSIKEQIDELFVCYTSEETLGKLIPNSKWIRINYIGDEYYVVGLIYNEEEVLYICYGIPSRYNVKPPLEIKHISEWVPTNINKPRGEGYWIIYQDAITGKTLPV